MHKDTKLCKRKKNTFKVQDRAINFNTTEHKAFIYWVSGSMLQTTFKKSPLVEYCCNMKEYSQLSLNYLKKRKTKASLLNFL